MCECRVDDESEIMRERDERNTPKADSNRLTTTTTTTTKATRLQVTGTREREQMRVISHKLG